MDRARPVTSPRRGDVPLWRLPEPPAMIRHRPRTRGVAAQHASLSRWRSPVRIRSGPPSTVRFFSRPVRPPGRGVPLPATAVTRPVRYPAARDRPRSRLHPEGPEASRGTPLVARPGGRDRARPRRGCRVRRRRARRLRHHDRVTDPGPGRRGPDGNGGRPDRLAGPGSPCHRGARVRGAVGVGGARPARRGGRGDRPRHQLPVGSDGRADRGRAGDPRRRRHVHGPRARRGRRGRDPRVARRDPRRARRFADDPRHGRRPARVAAEAPQGARVPARGRRRRVGPGARLGLRRAVRGGPGGDAGRLAAHRERARAGGFDARLRPGHRLDPRRRRRHPPRPRRRAGDQGEGRRLPVRRRHGRHHRHLQGLLAVRLGPAVHRPHGQSRRDARSREGRRPRHRQLREPRPRRVPVPRQRHELHGQPRLHRGTDERGHRLGVAGQQPHR